MAISDDLIVRVIRVLPVTFEIHLGYFKIGGRDDVLPLCGIVPLGVRVVSEETPEFRAHPLFVRVFEIPVPDTVQGPALKKAPQLEITRNQVVQFSLETMRCPGRSV